jgi:hypothetical protein
VQLLDLTVLLVTVVGLAISFLAVWNIRNLKSELIEERRQSVNQMLAAIGDVESMWEAKNRAIAISEIMNRYDIAGLTLPLKSGGKVNFRLESTGMSIESA